MNGNFARSILCSFVTSVDFGWYSLIVGVCWLLGTPCSCPVRATRGQAISNPQRVMMPMVRNVMESRDFMGPLQFLYVRHIFPQEGGQASQNPLLESLAMPQSKFVRFLLLAGLGLVAGCLALAIAIPFEPQISPPLIALFSPGLKLAEFVTPETSGKSFAWTFSWFLRIAIAANTAFYYALFALVAYLASRRRSN
jgi:hypothetical protein